MKALRIICLALTVILCLGAMFACDSNQGNDNGGGNTNVGGNNNNNTTSVPNTPEEFLDIPKYTEKKMDGKYAEIKHSFTPQSDSNGYVLKAAVSMQIAGYSNDFTYFDSFVRVTWTYKVITDSAPGGVKKTFSTDISLDANGCGTYNSTLFFQGCRSVELLDINYSWSGNTTKK